MHAVSRYGALSVTEIEFDLWSVQAHDQAVAPLCGHTMPVGSPLVVIDPCTRRLYPDHHCVQILYLRRPSRRAITIPAKIPDRATKTNMSRIRQSRKRGFVVYLS